VPIPGASKIESIEDSVKAAEVNLSKLDVEQIDQATSLRFG
jgi:aryl-alcohol dehydrogenase-like predicted oxidoreductase